MYMYLSCNFIYRIKGAWDDFFTALRTYRSQTKRKMMFGGDHILRSGPVRNVFHLII